MMYTILLTFQIVAVVLSFFCIATLAAQKSTGFSKYMLLTCICSFVQNVGYLLEMTSKNLDAAMVAIKVEYIGTSFVMPCMLMFLCRYCKIKMNNVIKWILLINATIVCLMVWTSEFHGIYYSCIEFSDSGFFPHFVLTRGPYYMINLMILLIQFVAGIVLALISAFRTPDANMKKNYSLLTFACIIPLIAHAIGSMDAAQGYDPAPIGGAIGIMLFVFAIAFKHVFEVVGSAHESILMNLDEAIIIVDYQDGFQEANEAAYELFPGLSKVIVGGVVNNAIIEDILKNKGGSSIPINNRFYDATVREITSHYADRILIGKTIALRDITDSKLMLDRMNELREAADSANQAKSNFLTSISHEIRSPINVVVGISDVIIRDYDEPKLRGYAENIQNAAKSLLALINDILDFSKIESGKTNLVNDEYETKRLFFDMINTYEFRGKDKGIDFNYIIDSDIPASLYGDETRIRQVMTNILSNAFKYTRQGHVTLRAAFERENSSSGKLIISVEDSGIGIKREDIDKLFDVFVRLDERINRAIEGTGLGLNITKQLLGLMHGDIKVYSEYGKGSVFTAIIPQEVRSNPQEVIGDMKEYNPSVQKRQKVKYTAPNAKVLVVDDSRTNLIVAKALLRDTKASITTALSGFECLELVKKEKYDVIFLDHRMPEMDGVETLHKMNENMPETRSIPTIMLTANVVSDAREYYLKEGFTDFISKPVTEESITEVLGKYLPENLLVYEQA